MKTPDWLATNVSRETIDGLLHYVSMIEKWNPRINLISKSSLMEIWERHIWDSAQIVDIPIEGELWSDFGSGGGFPGIVLALFSKQLYPARKFQLVESDQRKAAFLRSCIRELQLNGTVLTNRIEDLENLNTNVISARALADLNDLLKFTSLHLNKGGVAIFPKGETWEKELHNAEQLWSFDCEIIKSKTNPNAAILKIKDIARV